MLKGDSILQFRRRFLFYLFAKRAVTYESGVPENELREFVKADTDDLRAVAHGLIEAGLVDVYSTDVAVLDFTGRSYTAGDPNPVPYWLTDKGLKEAGALSASVPEQSEQTLKGRMGFRKPNDG